MQTAIDFTSPSPINADRLGGQNKRLYDYLKSGNAIHCMSDAMRTLRIGYLNSRVSDLINKHNIPISKKHITVQDDFGENVSVVEYSITLQNIV